MRDRMVIGTVLMAVTVVLHASFLEVITRLDIKARPALKRVFGRLWKPAAQVLAVLGVKIAIITKYERQRITRV